MPRPVPVSWNVDKLWSRYFLGIGVELEGGWSSEAMEEVRQETRRQERLPEHPIHLRMTSDGSVDVNEDFSGELQVGPIFDTERENALQRLWKLLDNIHPTTVNSTCGLHVHFSFKRDIYYLRLMSPEVTSVLTNHLGEWGQEEIRRGAMTHAHPLWRRLAGECSYCTPDYRGDEQVIDRAKSYQRYTVVNYCKALHNTLEVRVLPGLELELAKRGISSVVYSLGRQLQQRRASHLREKVLEKLISEADTIRDNEESRARISNNIRPSVRFTNTW